MTLSIRDNKYVDPSGPTLPAFMIILLVSFAGLGIDIGFSLKPYMIFLFMFTVFYLFRMVFVKLQPFEVAMLGFYFIYCFSGIFALYASSSIRIIIGIGLYLVCYFLMRAILTSTTIPKLEWSLFVVGVLFNGISLGLYIVGLLVIGTDVPTDRLVSYGVMMDRGYPRLIGVVDDPNFYVFYNTLFFALYMTMWQTRKGKIALLVCVFTSVLTFSRGGLLALLILLLVFVVTHKSLKKIKMVLSLLLGAIALHWISISYLSINLYEILFARMVDFTSDGGSNRFMLWERAVEFITMNHWLGLGPYNFSSYNDFHYGDRLSVHNTFLDIAADAGLIGLFVYVSFLLIVIYQLYQSRLYQTKPYLAFALFGFILQTISLSIIINDMFFLYLAIVAIYLERFRKPTSIERGASIETGLVFNR